MYVLACWSEMIYWVHMEDYEVQVFISWQEMLHKTGALLSAWEVQSAVWICSGMRLNDLWRLIFVFSLILQRSHWKSPKLFKMKHSCNCMTFLVGHQFDPKDLWVHWVIHPLYISILPWVMCGRWQNVHSSTLREASVIAKLLLDYMITYTVHVCFKLV